MRVKSIILTVLFFCFLANTSNAQFTAQQIKLFTKDAKKEAKKLKNENWQVCGHSETLERAVMNYYLKLEESNSQPLTGEAVAENEYNAIKKAQHRANAQYAAQQKTHVTRDVNIKVSNEVSDDVNSQSEFCQTVQTTVDQQIKSLRPELTLIRKRTDGKIEAKILFMIKND